MSGGGDARERCWQLLARSPPPFFLLFFGGCGRDVAFGGLVVKGWNTLKCAIGLSRTPEDPTCPLNVVDETDGNDSVVQSAGYIYIVGIF